VALTRLSLTDFRSYETVTLAPGPRFVVLTGENGAGKTNILESISLLNPGRGIRGAALADMARTGSAGGFSIAARLGDAEMGDVDLGVGTLPTAPDRKLVRINGAAATATALSEWLTITWLTPAMDRLFMDGASERRRFLDRLVLAFEPSHGTHAIRYEAAMRQRNRILSDTATADGDWLTALEMQMAEHGGALSAARNRLITLLQPRLEDQPPGPFARGSIVLTGWNTPDDFARDLMNNRALDAAAGRTLKGPHRCDLSVTHLDKAQPAAQCSTGEQKALLLTLILSHADMVADQASRRPILLLDEVAAHLDPLRRHALFERLENAGGQVWMTGTEPSLFAETPPSATHFLVEDGHIHA
jgi:DNA replication and repair protein RecF